MAHIRSPALDVESLRARGGGIPAVMTGVLLRNLGVSKNEGPVLVVLIVRIIVYRFLGGKPFMESLIYSKLPFYGYLVNDMVPGFW